MAPSPDLDCAVVTATDGNTDSSTADPAGTSSDQEASSGCQIQEIASEVLRLRLVQSQHKHLEGQLHAATEKLRMLSPEKVLQMRSYFEHGLRLNGIASGLRGYSGVSTEALSGLMECICTVCEETPSSHKQEDLLAATQRLLLDPPAFLDRLSKSEPASSTQSRRLAPFLLSCDSGWRGTLSEAGQCYEALRSWLSCYYQFSLVSTQVQATNEQLSKQEKLLESLGSSSEPAPGMGLGPPGKPPVFRQMSGVLRSSSVQSTSSLCSRRSQSPGDRSNTNGHRRSSPRLVGSNSRGPAPREPSLKSCASARGALTERVNRSTQPLHAPRGPRASSARSHSPTQLQSSPSRPMLGTRPGAPAPAPVSSVGASSGAPVGSSSGSGQGGPSAVATSRTEPSPRLSRYGGPPTTGTSGLTSARTRPGTNVSSNTSPSHSPRIHEATATRQAPAGRRVVPGNSTRLRRTPSQEKAMGVSNSNTSMGPTKSNDLGPVEETPLHGSPSPRQKTLQHPISRSRSTQQIGQTDRAGRDGSSSMGTTPPVSSRGKQTESAGGSRLNTSRLHGGNGNGGSGRSPVLSQNGTARGSMAHQQVPPRVSRLSSAGGYQPLATNSSFSSPSQTSLRRGGQHSRSSALLPSGGGAARSALGSASTHPAPSPASSSTANSAAAPPGPPAGARTIAAAAAAAATAAMTSATTTPPMSATAPAETTTMTGPSAASAPASAAAPPAKPTTAATAGRHNHSLMVPSPVVSATSLTPGTNSLAGAVAPPGSSPTPSPSNKPPGSMQCQGPLNSNPVPQQHGSLSASAASPPTPTAASSGQSPQQTQQTQHQLSHVHHHQQGHQQHQVHNSSHQHINQYQQQQQHQHNSNQPPQRIEHAGGTATVTPVASSVSLQVAAGGVGSHPTRTGVLARNTQVIQGSPSRKEASTMLSSSRSASALEVQPQHQQHQQQQPPQQQQQQQQHFGAAIYAPVGSSRYAIGPTVTLRPVALTSYR